ncbi:MAG: EAL domain-containing protein [Candidatus Thiodiazotropha endolucinida]
MEPQSLDMNDNHHEQSLLMTDDSSATEILLVEDLEAHALLISRAFETSSHRFSIKIARCLTEARNHLARHEPDLVVADYRLPDGVGTELLPSTESLSSYPIVIMTGQGDEQTAVEAIRAGALDYIVKSKASITEMPRIVARTLREWDHIQQCRKAELALALSEERYALAAKGSKDGLWDWNLSTGTIYCSSRWQSIHGFADHELDTSADSIYALVHPDDIKFLKAAINRHLDGRSPHLECEYRMRHKDGTYRWALIRGLAIRGSDSIPYRMAGSLTDITHRKLAEQQLQHDAFHDSLTDLPNRALFIDRLGVCLERTNRQDDYLFAVLFIDLDRFKMVNDSLGHTIGDQLLKQVASRLVNCLRAGDTVARLGGDEFVVILDGIEHPEKANQIAQRMEKSLEKAFNLGGKKLFTTASVGIALGSREYQHPEDIIRDADTAMYQAKTRSRGHYEVFNRTMRTDAIERLQMENDMRWALERREFSVFYQPIVSLNSGCLEGLEALVRWQHPERGLVPPDAFVPMAEENGLINSIGHFVLEHACQDLHRWQRELLLPNLYVCVNLSAIQLTEKDLINQVVQVLKRTQLNPGALKLEITENLVMENPDIAIQVVLSLKEHGIGFAIDDFGIGYSSLSYLHRFPVDILKIDRSFVSRMDRDENGLAIIRTIIALARSLKMTVTAEGVENITQLRLLQDLECNHGQGFYFSEPQNASSTQESLRDKRGLKFQI